jgi:hypothetical protein
LREELKKYPYRIQLKEKQTTQNKKQRFDFANKTAGKVEGSPKCLNNVLFSDEAHFELSGYVNRQNMRIRCEGNPHDTIEAPKSREKVTVFVAIGGNAGLIGPYFLEDDTGSAETIKTSNYLKMSKSKMVPTLKRKKLFRQCIFQQDGAPAHCSKEAIKWLTEQFGENRLISRNAAFKWPPYSPDLMGIPKVKSLQVPIPKNS